MRRKVTKAAALLSAVLMASSSVPYGVLIPYNVLAEEVSADAGAAVQEETAATVGSVTNIKTWDAAGLLACFAKSLCSCTCCNVSGNYLKVRICSLNIL